MILVESETATIVLSQDTETVLVGYAEREVVVDSHDKAILVTETEVTSVFVGTPGPQGPPGGIGEVQFNSVVAPGATETVDGVSLSLVDGCVWKVLVADRVQNKRRLQTIDATHELGTEAFFTIGPIVGSKLAEMPYTVGVNIASGFMNIDITNTGANDLIVEVLRIKVDAFNT